MSDTVDFYFFFKSPFSYLAFTQLKKISVETGVAINFLAIKPEVLWPAVGNEPQIRKCPPKFANAFDDIQRWTARYKIPFELNSHMEAIDGNTLAAGLFQTNDKASYVAAMFDAMWAHPRNLSEPDVVREICATSGLDTAASDLVAQGTVDQTPLDAGTKNAIDAGVFGAPSFIYAEKLFFGNDRVDFLIEAIKETRGS